MTVNNNIIKPIGADKNEAPCGRDALLLDHVAESIKRSVERLGERVCPICGKLFYPPDDEWAYRRAGNLICSWHCVCSYDRAEAAARDRKRAQARQARHSRLKGELSERDRAIYKAYGSGESCSSIAARYYLSPDHVRRIVRRCARHGAEQRK